MGLFGKKDPCAICGGKVKGLFPSKIDGQLICADCYGHTDLPNEVLNSMTVQDFKGYMVFREENELLKNRFQVSQKVDFGWLDDKFLFDYPNRLLGLALMEVAFPNAPEMVVDPNAPVTMSRTVPAGGTLTRSPSATSLEGEDVVAQIQRFKALMDQGILTEEEFAAKKKQLLGI